MRTRRGIHKFFPAKWQYEVTTTYNHTTLPQKTTQRRARHRGPALQGRPQPAAPANHHRRRRRGRGRPHRGVHPRAVAGAAAAGEGRQEAQRGALLAALRRGDQAQHRGGVPGARVLLSLQPRLPRPVRAPLRSCLDGLLRVDMIHLESHVLTTHHTRAQPPTDHSAYPIPPNLNHLGSDLCRGMLAFSERKPLGPDGLDWLKVHLANLCGKDKVRPCVSSRSMPACLPIPQLTPTSHQRHTTVLLRRPHRLRGLGPGSGPRLGGQPARRPGVFSLRAQHLPIAHPDTHTPHALRTSNQ